MMIDKTTAIDIEDTGPSVNGNGTSLMGYVKASYHELLDIFGEDLGSGDKVNAEFRVDMRVWDDIYEEEKLVTATIYDWKRTDVPYEEYNWHVGGFCAEAAWYVQDMLNQYRTKGKTDEN